MNRGLLHMWNHKGENQGQDWLFYPGYYYGLCLHWLAYQSQLSRTIARYQTTVQVVNRKWGKYELRKMIFSLIIDF